MVDDTDTDWVEVMDGRKFNHKYGFGKLDAYKLVEAAETFQHVKPQAWFHSPKVIVENDIPDNNVEGITSFIHVSADDLKKNNFEKIEHVQVWMNLTHQRRGDVVIDLISPTGIVSHIATKRKFDTSGEGMVGWYFMSVKHWYSTLRRANIRGESGLGNWTVQASDQEPSFTGKLHSWQLILWGSSIDPSIAVPHPLPGDEKDESSPTVAVPEPTKQPTVSPPHETPTSASTPTPSAAPSSGFWPWSAERKMVWIYGSIAVIGFFVSVLGIWYAIQRRKASLLRTHGQGREDYEFEILPNEGDARIPRRRAGELYDAFAGGEEYLTKSDDSKRTSGEGVDDGEIEGFLADSDEEELDEKDNGRLLKDGPRR
jgi:kexin